MKGSGRRRGKHDTVLTQVSEATRGLAENVRKEDEETRHWNFVQKPLINNTDSTLFGRTRITNANDVWSADLSEARVTTVTRLQGSAWYITFGRTD